MNDEVESLLLDLHYTYRRKYKETGDKHYKYVSDKLLIANKEIKQYHKLQKQMFPNFRGNEQ